jgi:glyceraldehyde 3-phosphate dehydrogenase
MKIGINGFGRIGRAVLRIALEEGLDVVAINDLHGVEDAAYLLKYDSVYGKYEKPVKIEGGDLIVGGHEIKVLSERNPKKLPWKKLGVKVVVESTGAFTEVGEAFAHIVAGAKKVLISAPCKGPGLILVPGVNDSDLGEKDQVISVASCTTNCLAPVAKVLNDNFKIREADFSTTHAYTASQALVDTSDDKKRRRGRAAALNIIPSTTGASGAVERVIPELKGKIKGMALRVPVPDGSIVNLVAEVEKPVDIHKLNEAFRKAASGAMKGVMGYTEDEIVSSDVIGDKHSALVDGLSTEAHGDLVRVLAWYDNEMGYAQRMIDVIKKLEKWV